MTIDWDDLLHTENGLVYTLQHYMLDVMGYYRDGSEINNRSWATFSENGSNITMLWHFHTWKEFSICKEWDILT